MTNYAKGARSERELLNVLSKRGYSVIRSAGSGVNALSPDLIAVKKGRLIAVECKAWESGSLALDPEQHAKLLEWETNSAFPTFVAWRMNNMGWFFIKLSEFERGKSNWNITRKRAVGINRKLEEVLEENGA